MTTKHQRELAAYELTVSNLTAERDEYQRAADEMAAKHKIERDELFLSACKTEAQLKSRCACTYGKDKRVSQCELHQAWYDTLHEQAGYRRDRDSLAERVKALEADAGRYRWIAAYCRQTSEHLGGRWSIVIDGPVPKSNNSEDDFDAAIDAAIKGAAT